MRSLLARLTESLAHREFLRSVLTLAGGSALAQVLALAATPVITRIYEPELYGTLGAFTAVLMVLVPLAGMALPLAIIFPTSDEEAYAVTRTSLRITELVSLFALVAALVAGPWLSEVLGLGAHRELLALLPLALYFSGLSQIGKYWRLRERQFAVPARASVANTGIAGVTQIVVGLIYPSALGLAGGYSFGLLAQSLLLGGGRERVREYRSFRPKRGNTRRVLRRYKDYPLFRAPQQVLNTLSQSLPILALTITFGPALAGFFALARLAVAAPSRLIGRSVLDAFYPRTAHLAAEGGDLRRMIVRTTLILAVIGLVPFGLVALFGPVLFATIFGSGWATAGQYAQWLALPLFIAFTNRPAIASLPALGMQGAFLIYEFLSVVARTAAVLGAYFLTYSDSAMVAAYALTGALLDAVFMLYVIRTAGRSPRLSEAQ